MWLPRFPDLVSWREALTPLAGWPSRGAIVRDLLLWLLLLVLAVASAPATGTVESLERTLTEFALFAVVTAAVVALSRPYPLLALTITMVAALWSPPVALPLLVVAYLAGRRMPRVGSAVVLFGVVAAGSVVYQLVTGPPPSAWWISGISIFAFNMVLPWLIGVYRRQSRELSDAGWERAKQLEREQRIVQEQARLRERSRIAQDMHDSLGHELSLIALRAGALEVAPRLGEDHRRAAGELRASATTATERLQEIIGVLREDAEPVPMDPAGEGVATLVERARASGMEVRMERHGDPRELPAMADRAVYRVVQEALTNATKHAPGAPVLVRLVHGESETVVTVRNGPSPAGPLPGRTQGRRGLVALAERVRLAGGTFHVGEHEGGFLVRARLGHQPQSTGAGQGVADPDPEEESLVSQELRWARRRLWRGVVGTGAGLAVLAAVAGTTTVLFGISQLREQVLEPDDFEALRVGQDRVRVMSQLPAEELDMGQLASSPEEPERPEGATCRYYLSSADLFTVTNVYRLCFDADVLVSKDTLTYQNTATDS